MTRVLVIDDDPMVGKTLVDLLGLHDYPATRTESGELGLEALTREPFDLVLLDVRLPEMSGLDLEGDCTRGCRRAVRVARRDRRHGPALVAPGSSPALRSALWSWRRSLSWRWSPPRAW